MESRGGPVDWKEPANMEEVIVVSPAMPDLAYTRKLVNVMSSLTERRPSSRRSSSSKS